VRVSTFKNKGFDFIMSAKKERHGQFTQNLGRHLRDAIESRTNGGLRVHFDHGGSESEKIVAHMGEKSSRANALSYIDIAVVEEACNVVLGVESQRVVLLCEVEEEGARPKKIIGNLCNILFANGVQISGSHYHLDKTYVLLGVRCSERSKAEEKTEEIIERVKKIANRELIVDIKGVYGCSCPELMEIVKQEILEVSGVVERRA
jgi:hypothetical protein